MLSGTTVLFVQKVILYSDNLDFSLALHVNILPTDQGLASSNAPFVKYSTVVLDNMKYFMQFFCNLNRVIWSNFYNNIIKILKVII